MRNEFSRYKIQERRSPYKGDHVISKEDKVIRKSFSSTPKEMRGPCNPIMDYLKRQRHLINEKNLLNGNYT